MAETPDHDPSLVNGSNGRYNPMSYLENLQRASVMEDVRDAIRHHRTTMAFQQVVSAANPTEHAFYEGLIRIRDRSDRIIPARDFVNVVESTELGRQIDCLALEHGLHMLRIYPALRLSINMSARSVGHVRWINILEQTLQKNPAIGARLILEITEQSAIQIPELVSGFMKRFQGLGISFALDDFGSGFTSFRYLKDFYFDILKIDGAFIRGVAGDVDSQIIVNSMIALSREFGMLSVAEHVETIEDSNWLCGAGVDCMQGYLYGAPRLRPGWMAQEATDRPA